MFSFKRSKDPKAEIKKLIGDFELPPFSDIVMRSLSLLRDPESSLNAIGEVINYDPALVTSIFKMVNSAAFGLVRHVDNISQAVALLGRARLESIVLAHAVKQSLPKVDEPWFSMSSFWDLAVKKATLARHIAQKFHPATSTQSFTAGMLQDVGMVVFASEKKKEYGEVIKMWKTNDNLKLIDIETNTFKFDHQNLGKLMAEDWMLPEHLIGSISGHHQDGVEPAIKIASYLTDNNLEKSSELVITKIIKEFGISIEEATEILEGALEDAKNVSFA